MENKNGIGTLLHEYCLNRNRYKESSYYDSERKEIIIVSSVLMTITVGELCKTGTSHHPCMDFTNGQNRRSGRDHRLFDIIFIKYLQSAKHCIQWGLPTNEKKNLTIISIKDV